MDPRDSNGGRVVCLHAHPTHEKPTLFVEVKLDDYAKKKLVNTDTIRRDVRKWLMDNFASLKVSQYLDIRSLPCLEVVQCVRVADHSKTQKYPDETNHLLAENDLHITIYSVFDEEVAEPLTCDDGNGKHGDSKLAHLNILQLPHKKLEGLWECLMFPEPIPQSTLRILTRMIDISTGSLLNDPEIYWHNIVLFYGPPGSGKTTLAKALAQKLSIRMSQTYYTTKFVEVSSHTLLSKWFGESSKLVGKLFETILSSSMDETALTVVFIDEVETLASSREKASRGNECGDVVRSTNELLQGLDRLRQRPNVVIICTSNLVENIDSAFIDRCGIEQHVGPPSVYCSYEILRSVINKLIKANLVAFNSSDLRTDPLLYKEQVLPPILDQQSAKLPHDQGTGNMVYVPELNWVDTNLFNRPETAPRQLKKIAESATGLSGRSLRRLPMLAITKYTVDKPCDLQDLLLALNQVLRERSYSGSKYGEDPGKIQGVASEDEHMDNEGVYNTDDSAETSSFSM